MHLWISIQRGGGEGEDWMSIWSQLFKSEIVLSSGDTGKSLSTGWELPKSIELSSRYHPLNNQGQEFCFLSSQDNIQKKDTWTLLLGWMQIIIHSVLLFIIIIYCNKYL